MYAQFIQRALECGRLARSAGTPHDRLFFTELARAWLGVRERTRPTLVSRTSRAGRDSAPGDSTAPLH